MTPRYDGSRKPPGTRPSPLRAGWALAALLAALGLGGAPAHAAPQGPAGAKSADTVEMRGELSPRKKKEPIHITSDRMEAYGQRRLIVFIGSVSAIQGDMQIQSDRLEVYVKKQEKDAAGKKPAKRAGTPAGNEPQQPPVERIIAIGNVLLNQSKTKYAASDRLVYNNLTEVAVLTGNPRAWEGNNQIIGTKIELYMKENRTVVYGTSRRRVNVTIYPEGAAKSAPNQSEKRVKRSDGN